MKQEDQNTAKLAQHFMTDTKIITEIVDAAKIKKEETILEIGAGEGILTEEIAKRGCKIISYEIDTTLKDCHKDCSKNITYIYKNALEEDLPEFDKIVANIPYNIAEPLILKLSRHSFTEGILTVNKSFADKLLGNTPSLLSIAMPSYFIIKHIRDIPRRFFSPPPKTTSSLIRITPIKKEDTIDNPERYIIRLLFDQKTRKVKNALMEAIIDYRTIKDRKIYTKREAKQEIKNSDIKERTLDKKVIDISYPELKHIINVLNSFF